MKSAIGVGIVGGLVAGVVFGGFMQMMAAPAPGGQMSMMLMVAKILGSSSLVVAWIYHLFNSAVIGAIFGAFLGRGIPRYGAGVLWGLGYGIVWWVVGGLVLMPVFLGMPAFAPLQMVEMRPVAWGSLMGHAMYGVILGAAVVWLASAKMAHRGTTVPGA